MSTKVGLVALVATPSARTRPCTNTVLPAPSSPLSATTSPGPSVAPSRAPAASVSSGDVVVSSAPMGEPTECLAQRVDDVAGDERLFADALGGDVAGETMQIDCGRGGARGVDPPREQRADDAGQH